MIGQKPVLNFNLYYRTVIFTGVDQENGGGDE